MTLTCFGLSSSQDASVEATKLHFAGWASVVIENASNRIEIYGDSSPEEADLVGALAAEVSSPNPSHFQMSHKLYGWESLQGFLAPGGSVVNLCQHTSPDASHSDRSGNAHVHFQNAKDVAACGLSTDHLTVVIDALTGQLYHWTDLNPVPQPVFSISATPLMNNAKFEKIWAGEAHLLALASNGTLYSWGSGRYGQLGHGDLTSESMPKPIESLQGMRIIDAACGASFSVALSEAGDIYSFGLNDHGQLSIGEQQSSSGIKEGTRTQKRNTAYPQLIDFYESDDEEGRDVNIVKVACGHAHTVVLDDQGHAWSCGWGKYGQLGQELPSSDFQCDDSMIQSPGCDVKQADRFHFNRIADHISGPWQDVVCGLWSTFLWRREGAV